jgi:hypothetical protein
MEMGIIFLQAISLVFRQDSGWGFWIATHLIEIKNVLNPVSIFETYNLNVQNQLNQNQFCFCQNKLK